MLLNGCEAWTLMQTLEKPIDTFQRKVLRRMLEPLENRGELDTTISYTGFVTTQQHRWWCNYKNCSGPVT